jgi:hypothetical protein
MASVLLGCLVLSVFALWLWLCPPHLPILPAAAYLLLGLIFCYAFMMDRYYLVLAVAFSFPWGLLMSFGSSFFLEYNFGVGTVLNAILIYGIGKVVKRRNELQL